jgi:hypothetical protein
LRVVALFSGWLEDFEWSSCFLRELESVTNVC